LLKGEEVKDGTNLGITGYESIKLDGKVFYGQAWVDVTKENADKYPF
jgi:simple sugar transport system substrate-binding protein